MPTRNQVVTKFTTEFMKNFIGKKKLFIRICCQLDFSLPSYLDFIAWSMSQRTCMKMNKDKLGPDES